jgi:lipoprotein-releasing system permease protein
LNRTLIWKLALRYLRGKGAANAVPILSRISMVAIAVSSAAMIIVFSVMNSLVSLAKEQYNAFSPDIRITATKGKFFRLDSTKFAAVKHLAGDQNIATVIEDNVFANNFDHQKIITLKGIDNDYFNINDIRDYIVDGDTVVGVAHATEKANYPNTAIFGKQIMNELGADINAMSYVMLYYPNPGVTNPGADPLSALQSLRLHPAGIFEVSDEFDSKYVFAPLSLVQELFVQPGNYSSIEVGTDASDVNEIQRQLKNLLGNSFKVETRAEQNKAIYGVLVGEKWAIYAILLLVLLIASFNMVGTLSMLVLEKQKDIAILRAMGAQPGAIRTIFLFEGMLWSFVGGLTGILLGVSICLLQQKFKLIRLNNGLLDSFPVEIQWTDMALVLSTILTVGLLTSWYPALRATKAVDPSLKST